MRRLVPLILVLVAAPLAAQGESEAAPPATTPTAAFVARLDAAWPKAGREARRHLLDELTRRVGIRRSPATGEPLPLAVLPADLPGSPPRVGLTSAEREELGAWLRTTLRSSPQDPELNLFLGTAVWACGRRELQIVAHHGLRESSSGYLASQRGRSVLAREAWHYRGELGPELLSAWTGGLDRRRIDPRERAALRRILAMVAVNGRLRDREVETMPLDRAELARLAWHAIRRHAAGPREPMTVRTVRESERPGGGRRLEVDGSAAADQALGSVLLAVETAARPLSLEASPPGASARYTIDPGTLAIIVGEPTPALESLAFGLDRALETGERAEALLVSRDFERDVFRSSHAPRSFFTLIPRPRTQPTGFDPSMKATARIEGAWAPHRLESGVSLLRTEGDALVLKDVFRREGLASRAVSARRSLFVEHASLDDIPDVWEMSLNGGTPLRFIAQPCPRPARLRLPHGLLKPKDNVLHLRRISGGDILLDGLGLLP